MRTIQGYWESYEREVVPASASEVQRVETQRAFYAGAATALTIIEGVGDERVSEDAGVAIITGLNDEVRAFAAAQCAVKS